MILWLWNFVRGYVRVDVTGFSVERFINMAAYRGIFLWDVVRTDAGLSFNVGIKGFKLLRPALHKTKCRMRISGKFGLPFIVYRYRKRKFLAFGVLFFILAMFGLSSFVWRVDIVGAENLFHEEIHSFLADKGLYIGRFKYNLDHDALARELLAHFSELGFAYLHTKGTRTSVMLAEAVPAVLFIDRSTPTRGGCSPRRGNAGQRNAANQPRRPGYGNYLCPCLCGSMGKAVLPHRVCRAADLCRPRVYGAYG
jgi:similar to stage IV sporulation protein